MCVLNHNIHFIFQDIVDVDFSIISDKLSVEWNNFYHPHLDLYFNVCAGTTIGGCDVTMEERIDGSISKHTFNNLVLTVLQVNIIFCRPVYIVHKPQALFEKKD